MSSETPSPEVPPGSPPSGKYCPSCGADYPFDALFCPRDGANLTPRAESADLIGQVIAERYHVLRRLGEGGMGRVYLSEHVSMARMCAIKVMHPSLRSDPEAVGRFRREAANAGRINHANVAAMYDCGETSDRLIYLAMEYVPGDSLATVLKWAGEFPPRRAISIAAQVADGLAAAHKLGIVHRDLKPDNIIVGRSKEGDDLAKVVDFGIAKATQGDSQTVTRTGFVVGTYHYMSPEQMIGEGVDGRSDLYSLGCILYEMLVGRRLFEGSTGEAVFTQRLTQPPPRPREVNPQVPKALDEVVVKLLARSREERFQSAEELRDTLLALPPEQVASLGRRLITPLRALSARTAVDREPPVPPSDDSTPTVQDARAPTVAALPPSASRKGWMSAGGIAVAGIVAMLLVATGRERETLVAGEAAPAPVTELLPAGTPAGRDDPAPAPSSPDSTPGAAGRAAPAASTPVPRPEPPAPKPQRAAERTRTAGTTASESPSRPRETAPATPARSAAPAAPPRSVLSQLRGRIDAATQASNRGDYSRALGSLRTNRDQIGRLREQFPSDPSLRSLAKANADALSSIRKSCEAVAVVAVEAGDTEIPNCN